MIGVLFSFVVSIGLAQSQADQQAALTASAPDDEFAGRSVRDVVREGNRRLLEGKADAALAAYDHAGQLLPDAREIAFGRGLADYDLKKYDEARAAFEQVAAEGTDALATDAQYSIAACDHMEALEHTDNPEQAISLLESAMRRYQRVLAENPHHKAALEANRKAASVWRRIKEMQKQQPKNKPDDDKQDNKDQKQDDTKKDKPQSQKNQDQKQKQAEDKQSDKKQQEEKEQEADSSQQDKQESSQQKSAKQKKQQVSREQAQRQLREMMQALRERKKARSQKVIKMPIAPVDKDW